MINHFVVQGRLVADPELRQTQSGTSVCSFRVAWSEKYKETETKLFLPCVAWRSTGEMISKYFSKGKEIIVEGKLSTRTWEKDGENRSSIELTVDKVHFCGPRGGDSANTSAAYQAPDRGVDVSAGDFQELADDGDLPF